MEPAFIAFVGEALIKSDAMKGTAFKAVRKRPKMTKPLAAEGLSAHLIRPSLQLVLSWQGGTIAQSPAPQGRN